MSDQGSTVKKIRFIYRLIWCFIIDLVDLFAFDSPRGAVALVSLRRCLLEHLIIS